LIRNGEGRRAAHGWAGLTSTSIGHELERQWMKLLGSQKDWLLFRLALFLGFASRYAPRFSHPAQMDAAVSQQPREEFSFAHGSFIFLPNRHEGRAAADFTSSFWAQTWRCDPSGDRRSIRFPALLQLAPSCLKRD